MSAKPDTPRACLGAPAKVNLSLRVLGRREDGYHLLSSLIAFVSIGDRVEVVSARDFSLTVSGPFAEGLERGDGNLALRAARLLGHWDGLHRAAHVTLHKGIPVAAGLGGGSADAAAVLTALARLWEREDAPLAELALELGADVPVCLASRPALVEGIGEIISPRPPLPDAGLLLVNPRVALDTGRVFAALGREKGVATAGVLPPLPAADPAALAESLRSHPNDLTGPAIGLAPVIGDVLAALEETKGCLLARMSGSGATCFGLFATRGEAEDAARAVGRMSPGWWCAPASFVSGRAASVL